MQFSNKVLCDLKTELAFTSHKIINETNVENVPFCSFLLALLFSTYVFIVNSNPGGY